MAKVSLFDRFPSLNQIPSDRFPKHLLIIPDGNGRWASAKGLPVTSGHHKGYLVANKIMHELSQLEDIHVITIWGFSSDNWKRSQAEVAGLMIIFKYAIEKILKLPNRRFIHLGRKDRMPVQLAAFIAQSEARTAGNTGQIFCLAIDFGGEDQTMRMMESVRDLPKTTAVSKELIVHMRDGKGLIPPADLLVRTSGEMRTSDIGWLNGAPTELYFIEKFFPDTSTSDIVEAIIAFSKRERRLGERK